MRKKERQLITVGLVVLFAAIAYWAYNGLGSGGFIDLSNTLKDNTTEDTYQLAVSDLTANVDQATGHVLVTFSLTNSEHFNISSVKVLYALNVNATFTELDAIAENGTYKAEIPGSFGDVVYYKIKVTYDGDKVLESEVQSITVTDTTAPAISNITVSYNSTTGNATFTITADDNDAIDHIVLFYAITADGNATSFSNVTLTTNQITLTIDDNTTDTTYYYVDFYVEAYDLSGNSARLPANGTFEFYANTTQSLVFPQSG